MKKSILSVYVLSMPLMGACRKNDGENKGSPNPPVVIPTEKPLPPALVAAGLNGELMAAGINWKLPKYLEGKFNGLGQADSEAALDLDLSNGEQKKSVHVNSGFTAKTCKPYSEAETFVASLPTAVAANVPDSLNTDVDEISSWTSESKTFKGRAYLKKRYKSEGDTGIYRIDVLLANDTTSQCVLWNFVFTSENGVSTEFIESSAEYKQLTDSLAATWKGIGAEFAE